MSAPGMSVDSAGGGPLPVSIDLSAVPSQPVGAGRYSVDLTRALMARSDVALTAWCRRDDASRWTDMAARVTDSGGGAPRPGGGLGFEARGVAPRLRPMRLLWEQARLPRQVDTSPAVVHHGPHYTMPERTTVPCVVTVHDLTFFDHPEWHERSKVWFFRRAIRGAARRAVAVVCVSDYTARRFEERCAPTGRVFVIPHGVDRSVFHPATPLDGALSAGTAADGAALPGARVDGATAQTDSAATDAPMLAALGVTTPYVLFLGTLEPRKAVPDLVAAFDRMARSRPDLSLVLAGRPGWGVDAVERSIGRARAAARVTRLGYVPDAAVPALLRGAAVAAYPAYEEGFGLPALEALACGTPLVTTAGTAMAETAGGAALLVPGGSIDDLAGALVAAVEGGPDQRARTRAGLEIAAAHTWEASAAEHVAAYRWATGHGTGNAASKRP